MSAARVAIAAALLLWSVAACDGEVTSKPNTAHVTGTVQQKNLTPKSAVARYGDVTTSAMPSTSPSARGLTIVVSDKSNTCDPLHTQGATAIALAIAGAQIAPGSYPIVDVTQNVAASGDATSTFDARDQACKSIVTERATSGSVTIKELVEIAGAPGGSRIRGSFTLVFPGGNVTGDFDALLCADAGDAGAPAQGVPDDAGVSSRSCTP